MRTLIFAEITRLSSAKYGELCKTLIPDMFGDDSCLSQINYHFKDKRLRQFQDEFKKDLNALNDAHAAERNSKGNKEGS